MLRVGFEAERGHVLRVGFEAERRRVQFSLGAPIMESEPDRRTGPALKAVGAERLGFRLLRFPPNMGLLDD